MGINFGFACFNSNLGFLSSTGLYHASSVHALHCIGNRNFALWVEG